MPSGAAVQAKVAAALKRLNATSREVKLSKVQSSGGDSVLGLGNELLRYSIDVDPQPAVEPLKAEDLSIAGSPYQFGDYRFTFAGSMDESDLTGAQIIYGEEVLQIISMDPYTVDATIVAWTVVGRSIKAAP